MRCAKLSGMKNKIFDPFVTSKRGAGCCGLGTHIVYNLVTQLFAGTIIPSNTPTPLERDALALMQNAQPILDCTSPIT